MQPEYKILKVDDKLDYTKRCLREMSRKGWEVIAVDNGLVYFRRSGIYIECEIWKHKLKMMVNPFYRRHINKMMDSFK